MHLIQMKQQDKHMIINDVCLQVPIFLGKWRVREECLRWASQGNTFLPASPLGVMSLGLFVPNGARQGYHCWCSPQLWESRVAMFSSSLFSMISLLKTCVLEGLDVRCGGFRNQESGLKWDWVVPTMCSGPVDWGVGHTRTDCRWWTQAPSFLVVVWDSHLTILCLGPVCDGRNGRSWLVAAWWWLSQFLQSSVCYTWQVTSSGVSVYYCGSQESGDYPVKGGMVLLVCI